ncbi:ion channel protein [Variovorax sp. J22P168]|uniref:ion channel protein n=1 Tax=Variovorax jilinensis TaxID=3053513 RepID=UPI00257725B6|nr:ion channel protein [Variovorax sp. J22P168]MDM0014589.1 ion channel protein [Variovorax sp. J22P168]
MCSQVADMLRDGSTIVSSEGRDMIDPRVRSMLALGAPAILVGIAAALILLVVVLAANLLQHFLWQSLPSLMGATANTWWWILGVMTFTGLAVGLVVRYVPGHAGPDPATVSLFGAPTAIGILPSLALALILALAGGVSLGPENPIIAIIVGLTVAIGARLMPRVAAKGWVMLAAAGTIGAMFGTPVAAALLFSEMVGGDKDTPIWDSLFAPLVAAGAGALTMSQFEEMDFSLPIDPYLHPTLGDIGLGMLVALAAIAIGMAAVWLFPRMHRLFNAIGHPVLILTLGGFLLGLLGIWGGPITMFKGLAEMKTLANSAGQLSASTLAVIVVIKLVAVLISATCGFRGGRIFPMVFVGVAFGLFVHQLFPAVPMALAIACSVLGFTLVVTRDGWLSLFMGAIMIPGIELLPLLCVVILPAWLVLAGRSEMLIKETGAGKT